MTILVKKEIRLLFPAFAAALALAVFSARVSPFGALAYGATQMFFVGIMLLGASSFGREVSLKTFPLLLAQPVNRTRVWRIKMSLLAAAVAAALLFWRVIALVNQTHTLEIHEEAFYALVCVALAVGAVCLTLLLRQFMAAFWLSFLLPVGLGTAVHFLGGGDAALAVALGLYAVAAFVLARWQFLRAQDTAWDGGIVFVGLQRRHALAAANRSRHPWRALLAKELQLGQATLLATGVLLVFHLASVALRRYGVNHHFSRSTREMLSFVGTLWLVPPVMWGCQSVTEERKMGTLDPLLALPVSRAAQWFLKLALTAAVGLLSVLAYATIQTRSGADSRIWHDHPVQTIYSFIALGLAGFYASTLAREIPQALGLAVAAFASVSFGGLAIIDAFRMQPAGDLLLMCLFFPTMIAAGLWLSYRNLTGAPESWSMWRRNLLTLAGAAVLAFALIELTFQRAWEWLTPNEPPHGPPRLSLQSGAPDLRGNPNGIAIVFPDGKLWSDRLVSLPRRSAMAQSFLGGRWQSEGGNSFDPGANWAQAVRGLRATVAIRSDGTLWISHSYLDSDPAKPARSEPWTQFGVETNWQDVAVRYWGGVFLLKRDGTLWEWDTTAPAAAAPGSSEAPASPRLMVTNTDWTRLMDSGLSAFAWRRNGTAWVFNAPGASVAMPNGGVVSLSVPAYLFQHAPCRTLIPDQFGAGMVALRDDGTLWSWFEAPGPRGSANGTPRATQIGSNSAWASVASADGDLIASQTDGSLWRLKETHTFTWAAGEESKWTLIRLSQHNDWLTVGQVQGQLIALAADGGLWRWDSPFHAWWGQADTVTLFPLRASRKPQFIENIFAGKT